MFDVSLLIGTNDGGNGKHTIFDVPNALWALQPLVLDKLRVRLAKGSLYHGAIVCFDSALICPWKL
jgi:hypothetical protein